MDLSSLAAAEAVEAAFHTPAHEIVKISSDDDDEAQFLEAAAGVRLAGTEADTELNIGGDEVVGSDYEDDRWDNESLLEATTKEIGDAELPIDLNDEICTLAEAKRYRKLLIELGPVSFCQATVESEIVSARKLVTAFGLLPPSFMAAATDEDHYTLLSIALGHWIHRRTKLPQYNTIDDVVQLLQNSKNIVVITGAGISTSLGIPDFRSKDIGLYSKLEHLGLSDPQEVFNIELFREDPKIFYSIAKDILPETKRFSPTHAFIKLLHDKGKLLTNYTQNIDNLEGWAGIPADKLIQCHGSFATASCTKCSAQVPGDAIFADIKSDTIPRCKQCIRLIHASLGDAGTKRKRSLNGAAEKKRVRKWDGSDDSSSSDDSDDELAEAGIMKPDITFFGEQLPSTFSERLTKHDKDLVDFVVVIGTSLKVAPVSEVIPFLREVPQVYISRTPVSHLEFDVDILGDCDVVVAELARRAGWQLRHEMIPEEQAVAVQKVGEFDSRYLFTVS